jgi:hypothetical protein
MFPSNASLRLLHVVVGVLDALVRSAGDERLDFAEARYSSDC